MKYIPKANIDMAKQLAEKKYLLCKLNEIQSEEKLITKYLNQHQINNKIEKSNELIQEKSRYFELLSELYTPLDEELAEWMKMPYEKNTAHSEHLKHKSISGNILRSKSEMIIDNMLHSHNIPYRYECPIELEGQIIYPDFTIRHPRTGELYYWEHFGKMHDEKYVKRVCWKLQMYAKHGIIPSVNLIITYETDDSPFDEILAGKLLEYYFG